MKRTAFWSGIGAGFAVGAVLGMAAAPRKQDMKTCVGRTIQKMGTAVDCALENWLHTEQ